MPGIKHNLQFYHSYSGFFEKSILVFIIWIHWLNGHGGLKNSYLGSFVGYGSEWRADSDKLDKEAGGNIRMKRRFGQVEHGNSKRCPNWAWIGTSWAKKQEEMSE
jgi:hypothetical protein